MPDQSSHPIPEIQSKPPSAQALEMVACPISCPVCFGQLRLSTDRGHIVCTGCQRKYPINDGIPVLIPGRAILE